MATAVETRPAPYGAATDDRLIVGHSGFYLILERIKLGIEKTPAPERFRSRKLEPKVGGQK